MWPMSTKKRPKNGRPPKPASEVRSERLELKFTKAEMKRVDKTAGAEPIATWIHDLVMAAVEQEESEV